MKQGKSETSRHFFSKATLCLAALVIVSTTQAATVTYTLDNVLQDNAQQMTGSFDWTYTEDDFENGSGVFTELFIPGHGSDIDALTINFDIAKSIEFSLTANVHGGGVNVSLFLLTALTPTQSALLDLSRSSYEIEGGGSNGGFTGGSVSPTAVPVPAAAWLFGSGLLGMIGMARRKKATG